MLEVTDRALEQLTNVREASDTEPGQTISLIVTQDNAIGIGLAHPQDEDQIVEHEGEPALIVPEQLTESLDGHILDYVVQPDGQGGFRLGPAEEIMGSTA